MWELDHKECWALKNWCFELYWRRLLRVPSTQSILKEINPESSLEGQMLKLKLQYFGHLMRWADSLEKTLMQERLKTEGEGDDSGWDGWMASPTWWIWVWVSSRSWQWIGKAGVLQSMGLQRVRHNWETDSAQRSVTAGVPGFWPKCSGNDCLKTRWQICLTFLHWKISGALREDLGSRHLSRGSAGAPPSVG